MLSSRANLHLSPSYFSVSATTGEKGLPSLRYWSRYRRKPKRKKNINDKNIEYEYASLPLYTSISLSMQHLRSGEGTIHKYRTGLCERSLCMYVYTYVYRPQFIRPDHKAANTGCDESLCRFSKVLHSLYSTAKTHTRRCYTVIKLSKKIKPLHSNSVLTVG